MNTNDLPMLLRNMTSREIGLLVGHAEIAILPVGSIEQHGGHLPIDVDLATVEYLSIEGLREARKLCGEPIGFIAPSVPYGGPGIGMTEWPGTICFRPQTLIDVVFDIGSGLIASGFQYLLVMNGCVGNIPALNLAVQKLKSELPKNDFILVGGIWEDLDVIKQVRKSKLGGLGHACELETSTALIIDPEHVDMEFVEKGEFHHPSGKVSFDFNQVNPFFWPQQFGKMTSNGVIGDPSKATAEEGRIILEANIHRVADILCHIKDISNRTP